MSDWTKQTEHLMNTWSDTQKKMWEGWLGAMNSSANLKMMEAERKKALETWETSVQQGLAAQAEWAKLWTEGLSANKSVPQPTLEWAKQMSAMMKSWTDTQQELSHLWFEMAKQMDPSQMGGSWDQQSKGVVKAWQDAVDKSLEAQKTMSQFWSQATAKKS